MAVADSLAADVAVVQDVSLEEVAASSAALAVVTALVFDALSALSFATI